ncbi:MAG: sensor histidine kinase [Acidobacteriaceae bacterium]
MKPYSITRRVVTVVLLVELLSALCVTGMALLYERHAHFQSFDILLRGRADSVLGAVQDAEDVGDNVLLASSGLDLPSEDVYEVRDGNNRLLGRSSNWDGPPEKVFDQAKRGFITLTARGNRYRCIRLQGLRIVDPEESGSGVPRHVVIIYGSPTRRVWQAVMGAVEFFAVANLLVLVVTGIAMTWLLHRSMAPIRQLAAEASGVSALSWNFRPPEQARSVRELAPLVTTLETLLHRLERSFRQQRQFVSDAAHELKTAVTVVKSSLQLLNLKPRSVVEYQAGLERCETDCIRLEELVGDMLMLARLENAQLDSPDEALAQTNMVLCVREIMEQFRPVAALRSVPVFLSAPACLCVSLTPSECGLLCSNILMNALQHSGADSAVTISLTDDASGFATCCMEDRGDGIEATDLPHVFERFYRGDPSRARGTGGTGLGLAICRAIVEKAHGEITIASVPGQGTTVAFRIPLALHAALPRE